MLCLVGGVIGLAIGMGGSLAILNLAGWEPVFSFSAAVLAVGFSAGVGVFFGMWPARRAATLAPIEALRYEQGEGLTLTIETPAGARSPRAAWRAPAGLAPAGARRYD